MTIPNPVSSSSSLLLLLLLICLPVLPWQSSPRGTTSAIVVEALSVGTSRRPENTVLFGEHRRRFSTCSGNRPGRRRRTQRRTIQRYDGLGSRRSDVDDDNDDDDNHHDHDYDYDHGSMMGNPLRKKWFGGSMEKDPQQQQQQNYPQSFTENWSSAKYQTIANNNNNNHNHNHNHNNHRMEEKDNSQESNNANVMEKKLRQTQTMNSAPSKNASTASIITPEMERQVLASAKARMDKDTVSRAWSVLLDAETREMTSRSKAKPVSTSSKSFNFAKTTSKETLDTLQRSIASATSSASANTNQAGGAVGGSHSLRNLVSRMEPPTDPYPSGSAPFQNIVNDKRNNNLSYNNNNNNLSSNDRRNNNNDGNDYDSDSDSDNNSSWNTQQIALASGTTTFLLSPIVVPIIHSLLPPILPFPSSLSFEGAAFLGTLSYILAIGDPASDTHRWNLPSNPFDSFPPPRGQRRWIEDGVEVTGAVSRILGRTALRSAQSTAPRLRAAARAVVEYDSATNTLAELESAQREWTRRVFELEYENEALKNELALWNAVESESSAYRLEELKEMARGEGVRGYGREGKNALMRRLVREGVLELDLTPFYREFWVCEEEEEDENEDNDGDDDGSENERSVP